MGGLLCVPKLYVYFNVDLKELFYEGDSNKNLKSPIKFPKVVQLIWQLAGISLWFKE